jgi:MOSC domain-containing protein YiiM
VSIAHIFQINVSDGGVPKLPVPRAEISSSGVAGDRQNNLEFHGGPDRAVCLFSLERIIALQAEGHPIHPGSTGENLTISGLEWAALVPGIRLKLGESLVLEITSYTTPCKLIATSFADGDSLRISPKTHPGWARLYARVLEPGPVAIADQVKVMRP